MLQHNKSFSSVEQAILRTILYSDIFSFVLTKEELWRFLQIEKKISRNSFEATLKVLEEEYLVSHDGYYCLRGRERSIAKRKRQQTEVAQKLEQAKAIARKIAAIPTILFIGISGGLAAGNVTKEDDIDLIIIVKENTLFLSRLSILGLLEKKGVRRKRSQKTAPDMICVNVLLDESALIWQKDKQDIYTAREIAQMIPLFERENTYKRFLIANKWMDHFLPHWTADPILVRYHTESNVSKLFSLLVQNEIVESLTRLLQISLMNKHQTKEIITNHFLALHPDDDRPKILEQFRLKQQELGLLTKI
jgi:hypothetical protein